MKKIIMICIFTAFAVLQFSCVQKTKKVIIHLKLHVTGIKDIKSAGIRGDGKPLSWDKDLEMKPLINDSLYTATFTTVTGYNFVECKFTVNGQTELNGQPNRRINFKDRNEVNYEATFNQP
ncbi:hypothetical protein [Mucilaginibacter sp. 44-25]|uniref:hypothetical protein n=1 Tax=Mucilaginibacter sp. 44-25 TaxID=1895794 RepID=UPI000965DB19|nr:hypothetical protein [Mucilaginibacter sp. 44-25]OJW13256.1 MAG: hypothetical protein BGO48_00390 [Mucilaginibacter sp. 44-25]